VSTRRSFTKGVIEHVHHLPGESIASEMEIMIREMDHSCTAASLAVNRTTENVFHRKQKDRRQSIEEWKQQGAYYKIILIITVWGIPPLALHAFPWSLLHSME
jgi:hypothetical protein